MHFRKLISADHLAAEDFMEDDFRPVERTMTIKDVTLAKPPAGGRMHVIVDGRAVVAPTRADLSKLEGGRG